MARKFSQKRGTTLVELVLYITIVGVFLFSAMVFALQILTINSLSGRFYELQSNMDFIVQKMTETIQEATAVDTGNCVLDSDTGKISLNMSESSKNPTQFYLQDSNVYMKEGTGTPIQINTELVAFDTLRFHNITYDKTPDQIVIDGTLTTINNDIANLDKEFTLHLSVSLRQ